MTRKDTILIAVVINAGLLAVLFTTAVIYDTDKNNEQMEFTVPLVENKNLVNEPTPNLIAVASTGDEVDNVLKYYSPSTSQPIVVQSRPETYVQDSIVLQSNVEEEETDEPLVRSSIGSDDFIEVKVKRGDVLEKIARANKTTIEAIKRANQLENEHLSIGQMLKIPLKQHASSYALNTTNLPQSESIKIEAKKREVKNETKANEAVYYIVKSGDNPWKIAKQFGVKYDEILRMNNLNEDKARNLKIGDRIRVK